MALKKVSTKRKNITTAKPAAKKSTPRKSTAKPAPVPRLELPKGSLLGAHTSTAGGVAQAIVHAQALGFTAAQIFVKNNKQWFAPPLTDAEIANFRAAHQASGIHFFAHNSYLINLGSQDATMFATSVKSMTAELERAESLGLPFIVMHPGSHGGAGEEAGLRRIAKGLREIVRKTPGFKCRMALEITAGQGTALGYKVEHLAFLINDLGDETRFGLCLDTAHLFAAGYNLRTPQGYADTLQLIEKSVGLRHVLALHLNDSKVPLGKRVDRHEHLGAGEIGLDCFTRIVSDKIWGKTPMVLETPKGDDMREDVENILKLAPYLQV
jgi:deoxyribonuclease-4